jgi:hypothetical protein
MGISLPKRAAGILGNKLPSYRIRLKIGDALDWTSNAPVEEKGSYCRWSHRDSKDVDCIYREFGTMDKVFLYLMDGEKAISFWKGSVSDFKDPNPKFKWFYMTVDKCVDAIEHDHEAGMIQFKMSVNHETFNGR